MPDASESEYELEDAKNYKILKWEMVDLMKDFKEEKKVCQGHLKNGKSCQKKATIYYREVDNEIKYLCKTHKKQAANDDIKEITKNNICSGINKNGKYCKKNALYHNKCDIEKKYCKQHTNQSINEVEKIISKNNLSFFGKAKLIPQYLDSNPEFLEVDKVLIENQPVYKNPFMKSIQMILYTYYLLRGIIDKESSKPIEDIILMDATQKLKIYDGPKIECNIKDKHGKNKFLAKEYCKYMIRDLSDELNHFLSHKKQDDLADSLLQALYYIRNSPSKH